MGLPSIDISFQTAARVTIAMGDKGYVGVIVRDTVQAGAHYLPRVGKIPEELSEENRDYLTRTFLGTTEKRRSSKTLLKSCKPLSTN